MLVYVCNYLFAEHGEGTVYSWGPISPVCDGVRERSRQPHKVRVDDIMAVSVVDLRCTRRVVIVLPVPHPTHALSNAIIHTHTSLK